MGTNKRKFLLPMATALAALSSAAANADTVDTIREAVSRSMQSAPPSGLDATGLLLHRALRPRMTEVRGHGSHGSHVSHRSHVSSR